MLKVMIRLICVLCLFTACQLIWAGINPVSSPQNTALQLFIDGPIGPATATYIQEGIAKATTEHSKLLILQLDTPGGLDTSMRKIVQDILGSPVPVVTYVAPAGARAASAGVFIMYASHIAAMTPGTNIGAATPVNIGPSEPKPDTVPDKKKAVPLVMDSHERKAVNDAAAYIRSLAQLRNRNAEWGELAVTKAVSLTATEALQQHVIDVVTPNQMELLQRINGMTVKIQDQPYSINTTNLVVQAVKPSWVIQFLSIITNPNIAYILILLGVYGLIYELASPGLVIPGVFGAIALLLGLYAFHLLPISYAGLALIFLGMAFMIAEAFVGSFGILAVGGIVAFALGSIFLLEPAPGFNLALPLIITISIISAGFFFLVANMVLRSRWRPVVSGIEEIIGAEGTLIKDMQGLRVRIHGEVWQVESPMELHNGQRIRVVNIKGLILVVEPI